MDTPARRATSSIVAIYLLDCFACPIRCKRVVKFDQQTRTMTVAVRVHAKDAFSTDGQTLPLVEGMFCSIEIPGKTMKNVIRLPRSAVSFENTVYLSSENRLKTVPVEVVREEGKDAFISEGIKQGDLVIITRLIDPLENSLVETNQGNFENGKNTYRIRR